MGVGEKSEQNTTNVRRVERRSGFHKGMKTDVCHLLEELIEIVNSNIYKNIRECSTNYCYFQNLFICG